jgi:TPR repeat protein
VSENRPSFPPFTGETAAQKIRGAEDGWNSCNPERVRWPTPLTAIGAIGRSLYAVAPRLLRFSNGAMLAASLMMASIPDAACAGPLEDAEEAYRKGDYATAIPIYRSLAEKGNVSAQMRLGFFYESGTGLKRDWLESAKWFSKAADGGNESAVFVLSFLGRHWRYRAGATAPPIIYELVEKVAKSGFAVAQFSLGVMYCPIGDPSFDATTGNRAQALVWYRRAAEQGDVDAQIALGLAYANGIGVVQDYIEADKWFNIAASRAHSAEELADILTRHHKIAHMMTSYQIAEAQKLAQEWRAQPER